MTLSDKITHEDNEFGELSVEDVKEAIKELKALNHNCDCDIMESGYCDFCIDLIRVFGQELCE